MHRALVMAPLLAALAVPASADSPADLAKRIQKAIAAKSMDALAAEVDQFATLTGMEQFAILDIVVDCQTAACTASVGPLSAKATERIKAQAAEGVEATAQPEGSIELAMKEADGTGSMSGHFPFAKVGGAYKIVGSRPNAALLAKLKATTPQAATDARLAKGIDQDPAWKSKAKPLPAGGGEAGQAWLASVQALGAAVAAKDVDAAAKARGSWGKTVLGPTDYAGKPRSLAERQLKLRSQSARFIVSAKVLGGYQVGDTAVLTIEGTNGAGNALKGPIVLSKRDGVWDVADHFSLIEIPKGL
ncbi:MAG: hypothetical protein ABW221_26100 [Vicinamibacteria bacterium]